VSSGTLNLAEPIILPIHRDSPHSQEIIIAAYSIFHCTVLQPKCSSYNRHNSNTQSSYLCYYL